MELNLDLILQIAGLTLGLIYLCLEYRADNRMWIVGTVMPLVSLWLYFRKGLYADCAMNVYYLLMALYGYVAWTFGFRRRKDEVKTPLTISHASARAIAVSVAALGVCWVAIWAGLEYGTDSTVPVADAFTTAGSIVGTWMLARKYVEQWIVWIVVDAVCVALYIYKGIPFYAILYGAYTVVAIFGYRSWRRRVGSIQ